MRRKNHRCVFEALQHPDEALAAYRIDASGRFIEELDLWAANEAHRTYQFPLVAARKITSFSFGERFKVQSFLGKADLVLHVLDAKAFNIADKPEILVDCQIVPNGIVLSTHAQCSLLTVDV